MPPMLRPALVLLAIVLASSIAQAQEPRDRIAIVELTIEGDAPPELRTALEKSLAGGLFAAGWEVVPRAEVNERLRDAPELMGCLSTTCLERMSELVGARRFVRARVEAEGASYAIELSLLGPDATGGGVLIRKEATCPVCTVAEANDAISKLASELKEEAPSDVPLVVKTNPSGARLELDGQGIGESPWHGSVTAGPHQLRARKPGYRTATLDLTVADPAPEVTIDLEREASSRWGVWKWVAIGGGVAVAATGVALIVIDDTCAGDPPMGEECPQLWDTMLSGVTLTVIGTAAAGAGVWMVLNDSLTVAPTRDGGAVAVWRGRF